MIWLAIASFVIGIAWACKKQYHKKEDTTSCDIHKDRLDMSGDITEDWLQHLACIMFSNYPHELPDSNGTFHTTRIMTLLKENKISSKKDFGMMSYKFESLYDSLLKADFTGCSCEYLLVLFLREVLTKQKPAVSTTIVAGPAKTITSFVGVHFNKEQS